MTDKNLNFLRNELINKFQKYTKNRNKNNEKEINSSYEEFVNCMEQYKENRKIETGMLCRNNEKCPKSGKWYSYSREKEETFEKKDVFPGCLNISIKHPTDLWEFKS